MIGNGNVVETVDKRKRYAKVDGILQLPSYFSHKCRWADILILILVRPATYMYMYVPLGARIKKKK